MTRPFAFLIAIPFSVSPKSDRGQMTEKGPAHPKSILRGHKTSVHAAAFIRGNERLLTGDSDGFVIVWDLTILRPRAVWQAHKGAILGFAGWGPDRIIT